MAASSNKFNLTELLNQRSKEVAPQQTAEEVKAGKITEADVYDLIPSQNNFYSVEDVQDLKQSIELMGVLQPLLVTNEEDGKRRVIAGHRRRLAVMQLVEEGKERFRYVPIMVKPAKDAIIDRLALIMTNRFREKTDWERMTEALETEKLVCELKKQMDIPGRTRDLLSEIVGDSPSQLGRYKAIYNNLEAELMEEFKAGKIGVSVIYEVSGFDREWQMRTLEVFRKNEALTLTDIKAIRRQQEAEAQVPGQMELEEINGQQGAQEGPETEETGAGEEVTTEPEKDAGKAQGADETGYIDPHPETVTSICYSCTKYAECHDKKSTVMKCNAYADKAEVYKTEEQRYSEEQDRIDAETRKKLREQAQEEKLAAGPQERPHQEIRLSGSRYGEITNGILSFLPLKKNGYRLGEELTLPEYAEGKATGRTVTIRICYIWDDWTAMDDDYCILGFQVVNYTSATAEEAGAHADQEVLMPGA